MHTAEQSGSVGTALERLAEWHQGHLRRANRIKAGLYLPAGVVVLGAFVGPLPALIGGQLSAGGYLWHVFWFLGRIAVLAWLLWQLPGWLRSRQAEWLDTMRIRMPFLVNGMCVAKPSPCWMHSDVVQRRHASRPGIAADNATNGFIRESFDDTHARLGQGVPLGGIRSRRISDVTDKTICESGDGAGALTDMLRRNQDLESKEIEAFDEQVANWVPRVVYAVVAGWLITNIL